MLMWSTVLPLPELCGDVKNARLRRFVRKTFEYLRASRKRWIVINSWQIVKAYSLLTVWILLARIDE